MSPNCYLGFAIGSKPIKVQLVSPHAICHVTCDNADDEHFLGIQAMVRDLERFMDYQGNPCPLIPLLWPHPQFKKMASACQRPTLIF